MKRSTGLRYAVLMLGSGAFGFFPSCRDIAKQSVVDGVIGFVTGSVQSTLADAQLADFIINSVTGGFLGIDAEMAGSI